MTIETKSLRLIPCDAEILKAAIDGNESLAKKMNLTVEDGWTEFGVPALQYALDKVQAGEEEERNWWTYFPVHRDGKKLIGSGGYKGLPDTEGTVEVGYEIAAAYRNHGFATEMTMGLIDNAFKYERVKSIIAHTLGEDNASTRVLHKCGFEKVQELNDPDEGVIWKWELKRS